MAIRDPDDVLMHDSNEVRFSERTNGCYVETDEHGQFLLKPRPVFREMQFLPLSDDTKIRMARILDNAIGWLEHGDGSEKDWFDDVTRADKLLKYVSESWHDDDEGLMLDIARELTEEGLMVCNRTGDVFEFGNWSAPTGSYVCTIKAEEGNRCPKCGAPKDKFWECIRSSNRTRVPNKYKCQNCGKTKEGITTG